MLTCSPRPGNKGLEATLTNEQWFESLSQARECIAHWRRDYNEVRPHTSLGRIPPARFAQQHRQRAGGAAGSEQKQNFD